jgi:hypothetical protein
MNTEDRSAIGVKWLPRCQGSGRRRRGREVLAIPKKGNGATTGRLRTTRRSETGHVVGMVRVRLVSNRTPV